MLDNYPSLIKEIDGTFFVICETYNIVTESKDLLAAYEEMKSLRTQAIARFERAKVIPSIPFTVDDPSKVGEPPRKASFLNGMLILSVVTVCLAIIVLPFVSAINSFARPLRIFSENIRAIGGLSPVNILVRTAETLKQLTPDRKAEIKQSIKEIVEVLEPMVNEIHPLFNISQEKAEDEPLVEPGNTFKQ